MEKNMLSPPCDKVTATLRPLLPPFCPYVEVKATPKRVLTSTYMLHILTPNFDTPPKVPKRVQKTPF